MDRNGSVWRSRRGVERREWGCLSCMSHLQDSPSPPPPPPLTWLVHPRTLTTLYIRLLLWSVQLFNTSSFNIYRFLMLLSFFDFYEDSLSLLSHVHFLSYDFTQYASYKNLFRPQFSFFYLTEIRIILLWYMNHSYVFIWSCEQILKLIYASNSLFHACLLGLQTRTTMMKKTLH